MQISFLDNLPFILIINIALKGLDCARHCAMYIISPSLYKKSYTIGIIHFYKKLGLREIIA